MNDRSPLRRAALWLALAGVVAAYVPTIIWLWGRWTMSVWHHAHGLLIPPVVGYFIYQELQKTDAKPSSSAAGFAVVIPALMLLALDAGMHTELLSAVSLVLLLPGLSMLLLGWPITRSILFPLSFLAFALPIPLGLTERLHMVLREITTSVSTTLIPYFGVPVFTEGTTIHLPSGLIQIADACSGFSTLYAAIAIAFLVAYGAPTRARQALVLLAAAPLAIGANILRVLILVLFVEWKGAEILETWIHPASGMMTFALALPAILWLGSGKPPQKAKKAVA